MGVVAADGGVDLDRKAGFIGPLDSLDGAGEGALETAKLVVNFGRGAVEGDAEAHDAGFFHLEDGFAGQQRGGAGGNGNLDALFGGIANQLIEIRALEGVAAGEDEDGNLHVGDLIDDGLALFSGELVGVRDGLSCGAAMFAGKITGLCDFPDGEERRFVEVQPAAGGNLMHGLHGASSRNRGEQARGYCAGGIRRMPQQEEQTFG